MKLIVRPKFLLIYLTGILINHQSNGYMIGIQDLPNTINKEINRSPFNPLAKEGIRQLIKRLGLTANEIEFDIDDILKIVSIEQAEMHCPIYLKAADFTATGTSLGHPGYYMICEDIEWEGEDSNSAITIDADHVTVDLNCHSIIQTGTGVNVNGMTINPDRHDITIKNGTLCNFEQNAIHIDSSTGTGCYNLRFQELDLKNSGDTAFYLKGADSSSIKNCLIDGCLVTNCNQEGIVFEYCHDCAVIKSHISHALGNGLRTIGANYKCLFIKCCFNDNGLWGCSSGEDINNSTQSFFFEQCTFNNNESGLNLNADTGSTINKCLSISNSSTSQVYGINIQNSQGTTLKSCTVTNNNSSENQCFGIRFYNNNNCSINSCTSCSNSGNENSSNCDGILIEEGNSNTILNCLTNNTQNTAALDRGIGIEIQNAINTRIQSCSAFSNSGKGIVNDNTDTNNPSLITGCGAGNNGNNPYINFGGSFPAHYAQRNKLGNHWEIGELENVSIETTGINEVGCVTYLDASAFGTSGFTIDKPGHYVLCENIIQILPGQTALTINANNVVFDMNNKSISGGLQDGIDIGPDLHDITIKNGSISGFTQYGIYVDSGCYHINLDSIAMSKADCLSAITFAGASNSGIHDCAIKNCKITEITATADNAIIHLNYCYDIEIRTSQFNSNIGDNAAETISQIVYLNNAKKCKFIDCQLNDNSTATSSELVILSLLEAYSLIVDNCTFNNNINNKAISDLSVLMGSASGSVINNSTFNNNSTTSNCYVVHPTASGSIIEACTICKNSTTGGNVVGIYLDSTSNLVKNCKVIANAQCYGIKASGNNNVIDSCKVIYNSGEACIGIEIDMGVEHTLVKDCAVYGNSGNGIDNNGTDSIIYGCAAGNNTTDYSGATTPLALDLFKTGTTEPQPVGECDNVTFTLVA